MPALYPIRAVAKLTGIPIETLRDWERRYQAVTPDRSARGRLYSDVDVRRLQLLRAAVEGGHAIGQVAALSDAELQALARTPSLASVPPVPGAQFASPNLEPLLEAIADFDSETINQELSKLALLLSPAELVYKVVLPLMRLVGKNWQNGTCTIAQEHMFSACMRNLLGGLVRLHRTGNGSGKVLLATPVDELHEFGILAAAMLAVAQGFQVTYLGTNLPAGEILTTAEKCMADIVALGIMKTNATPAVRDEMARLASGLPILTELWVGGTGATDVLAGAVRNGAFILDDLADFERHLSRWKAANFSGGRP
jgi:MerR family transcriptional regulator, light-induced transcriptional regulator